MAVKVFCGDEPYLIDYKVEKIKERIEAKDINISIHEDINESLISEINTAPFIDERKVVILVMDELRDVSEVIDSVPEYVDFIIVTNKVDKRTTFYKTLKSKNYIEEVSKLNDNELNKFIFAQLNKHNARITNKAYNIFLERVNYHEDPDVTLYTILIYIKQLVHLNQAITEKEVKKLIPISSNEKAFELSKALLRGRDDRVFALALDFIDRGENVISMLSLLQRLFRLGFKSSLFSDDDRSELAARIGAPLFQFEEATKYSKEALSRVLDVIQEAINGIKTGRCEKENMFLLALCKIMMLLKQDNKSKLMAELK